MGTYDEVIEILRSDMYDWPLGISPEPAATETALATMAPTVIAQMLENYCHSYTTPPYGYPGSAYEWARYAYFNEGCHFWGMNTLVALGLATDPPLDKVDEAKTVSEWYNAQDHGRTRLGFLLWDENDANSVAWHKHLFTCARHVPPEWAAGTDPMVYVLACREGYIQPGIAGFGAAYASQMPRYADVRGLTAQQWLENLRETDHGKPWPWPPQKPVNPITK